jgi:hypothetical protein
MTSPIVASVHTTLKYLSPVRNVVSTAACFQQLLKNYKVTKAIKTSFNATFISTDISQKKNSRKFLEMKCLK